MGKYKFRLSDMLPNAWFYKLKDMNGNRSKHNSSQPTSKKKLSSTTPSPQKPHFSQPFCFSTGYTSDKLQNLPFTHKSSITHFPEPARRSWRTRSRRKAVYKPSPRLVVDPVSTVCSCHVPLSPVGAMQNPESSPDSSFSSIECSPRTDVHDCCSPSEDDDDDDDVASWSSSCKCTFRSSNDDIIIDMNHKLVGRRADRLRGSDWTRKLDHLPSLPILSQKAREVTKSRSSSKSSQIKTNQSLYVKFVEEEVFRSAEKPKTNTGARKLKLRANSPRMAKRKIQAHARRNVPSNNGLKFKSSCLSESFAMIKASNNPQQDFRESMVEMIVENSIRNSKDLEDLLACYLILNSDEYHDLIIRTFEQIWFDMAEHRI